MSRLWLALAAVNGFIAVAAGAYAAHGFRGDAAQLRLLDTATLYQLAHALALLGVSWIAAVSQTGLGRGLAGAAGVQFTLGIVLFCGTLDALALGQPAPLALTAPLGGLLLMTGWATLLVRALTGPLLPRPPDQRVGTGLSVE